MESVAARNAGNPARSSRAAMWPLVAGFLGTTLLACSDPGRVAPQAAVQKPAPAAQGPTTIEKLPAATFPPGGFVRQELPPHSTVYLHMRHLYEEEEGEFQLLLYDASNREQELYRFHSSRIGSGVPQLHKLTAPEQGATIDLRGLFFRFGERVPEHCSVRTAVDERGVTYIWTTDDRPTKHGVEVLVSLQNWMPIPD